MSNIIFDPRFWATIFESPWTILVHIVDLVLVTYLLYRFIKALAGTKMMTLVQGVVVFVLLRLVVEALGLTTMTFLMNQIMTYAVIAGVVIFAPEIRAGLERIGRAPQVFLLKSQVSEEEQLIQALLKTTAYLSPRKIGALISIERAQTLQEYISTGIALDADISSELLINIFIPNTPLHDGAVIIRDNKVATACSYLPLSDSQQISKEFGTRHRAAIGLSEHSDAITLVVSEETGGISLTKKGQFLHDLSPDALEELLSSLLISEPTKSSSWLQNLLRRKV